MHLSDIGREQIAQLADALIAAERCVASAQQSASPRCFGIVGTLGAGKTKFCQEIARACGVDASEVTSPTFTLLKSYTCPSNLPSPANAAQPSPDHSLTDQTLGDQKPLGTPHRVSTPNRLHHLDWYRINDEDEIWELGLDELWEAPGEWTLIEWADRFEDAMPTDTIWVHIQISDCPANHPHANTSLAKESLADEPLASDDGLREITFRSASSVHDEFFREVQTQLNVAGFTGTIRTS
ncbi:MAG: tRNA (adenosine(37)-N6)-threonylcarbamoyltransferase complex ATPase subunit type 1 TsaE [Rhodopirellula sp. JB053]